MRATKRRGRGRGRGSSRRGGGGAAAAAVGGDAASMWVKTGDKVEVRSDEEGFIGVWYVAHVVCVESPSTCVVEYEQLLADDRSPLQELVFLRNLRPCPPRLPARHSWLQGDLVEAYDRDGWWAGVVVRYVPDIDLVIVRFRTTGEELGFTPSLLRGLQNWENGTWIDLTQVGQPDEYHPANAADLNRPSNPVHPIEKRKRGRPQKKFNGCELPGMEDSQVPRTNDHMPTAQELCAHHLEPPKRKIRLGLVAYQLLVEALHLKGPLNWEQEVLLSDVRLHLNITNEEQNIVLERFMPSDDARQ